MAKTKLSTLIDKSLVDYLVNGDVTTIEEIDAKSRETTRIQRRIRKRFDPAVWDRVYPKSSWSENALVLVTGTQIAALENDNSITAELKTQILNWLSAWLLLATEELRKQGLPVKMIGNTGEHESPQLSLKL